MVGRGGRGDRQGRAILQTFMPEHYIMNLAAAQDYKGFYREEMSIRTPLIFPPICDMCVFALSGEDEAKVQEASQAVLQLMDARLRQLSPETPVRVLGPVRASYGRISGKFRYRIIMKCKNTAQIRGFISGILTEAPKLRQMNKIALYADINGDVGV